MIEMRVQNRRTNTHLGVVVKRQNVSFKNKPVNEILITLGSPFRQPSALFHLFLINKEEY